MKKTIIIKGIKGNDFKIDPNDKLSVKIAMLFEGHCTIGVYEAIKKYGYTEQRYYQLLKEYNKKGSEGIRDKKRGSNKRPVRNKEITNQIIRHRFLDTEASTEVRSQKLKQNGYNVSVRSVERTITEYGLQKKLINLTLKKKKKIK
ncbi:MAG: hypothetical protein DRJ01_19185 [Bacteroidetes bacterium]|nr:MAG: hypothetical protein DRJ01_19185 [Bacteroidota bacterium]